MSEFPRTYDVIITPQTDQDVVAAISKVSDGLRGHLRYVCDNEDGTHTAEFTIDSFGEHPGNTNALRDAKFEHYKVNEQEKEPV